MRDIPLIVDRELACEISVNNLEGVVMVSRRGTRKPRRPAGTASSSRRPSPRRSPATPRRAPNGPTWPSSTSPCRRMALHRGDLGAARVHRAEPAPAHDPGGAAVEGRRVSAPGGYPYVWPRPVERATAAAAARPGYQRRLTSKCADEPGAERGTPGGLLVDCHSDGSQAMSWSKTRRSPSSFRESSGMRP